MVSYKAFILISTLLLISYVHSHDDVKCTHDDEPYTPDIVPVDEDTTLTSSEGRLLESSVYPNIRIYIDFTYLEKTAPASYSSYIKNDLAPPVVSWFEGALRVKYPMKGKLKTSKSTICDKATPSALKSGVNADFVSLFDSKVDDNNVVASSRACQLADASKRPLVATTIFNRNQLEEAGGDILLHEKNMYLLIHEMMHTFGISSSLYKYYIDDTGNTRTGHIKKQTLNGNVFSVIDLPSVTQRLRNFYGCSSIQGLVLENDGGNGNAGSHFERKYFLYETMCSGGIYGRRVSEFSLAVLEGTGWYQPDYSYAEPFFFGQGQGCTFLNGTCSSNNLKFDEYCTKSDRRCAAHGRAGGRCTADAKTDGCKYVNPYVEYDCENPDGEDNARLANLQVYGRESGSKCFNGDLNTRQSNSGRTTFCFKYTCSGSGSDTQLEVQVGNEKIVCDKEGPTAIDGYYGAIDCPDPHTFCNTVGKKYCPRNCMNRGSCVDNKCQCNSGFTGIDCGLKA